MTDTTERWKPVVGFEKYYQVSSRGKIATLHKDWKIKKCKADKDGYRMIELWDTRRFYTRKIHRLVLEAFKGPCPKGYLCSHRNDIPYDNRIENLTWATPKQNTAQMMKRNRHRFKSKLKPKDVLRIRHYLAAGMPQAKIAEKYSVHIETIRNIKVGNTWKTT